MTEREQIEALQKICEFILENQPAGKPLPDADMIRAFETAKISAHPALIKFTLRDEVIFFNRRVEVTFLGWILRQGWQETLKARLAALASE